jgi:hypothetical protein
LPNNIICVSPELGVFVRFLREITFDQVLSPPFLTGSSERFVGIHEELVSCKPLILSQLRNLSFSLPSAQNMNDSSF